MAGLLLILVIVNAAVTGWLFAKVRYLSRVVERICKRYAFYVEEEEGDVI